MQGVLAAGVSLLGRTPAAAAAHTRPIRNWGDVARVDRGLGRFGETLSSGSASVLYPGLPAVMFRRVRPGDVDPKPCADRS